MKERNFSLVTWSLKKCFKNSLSETTMDWKEYIKTLSLTVEGLSYGFNLPVSANLLEDLSAQFSLEELPRELEELYYETNGVDELLNGEKIGYLIWTIDRVIEINKEYRTGADFKELQTPFDQFFFIADAGNGDLFGFETHNGKFDRYDIFVWDHETDSRTWVAPNLATFIKWWTDGTIKV